MKIEIELSGFTPILDIMVQQYGLITAAVYGVIWRYAQMDDKVCKASLEKIGKRLNVSGKTIERHTKKLCADGYLVDLTPNVRNKPHSYAVTGKAELSGAIIARSDRESDQGKTESLTRSDRESDQGKTESPLKIHDKIQTKIPKDSSATADHNCPISFLSEKEIKALKLPLSAWQQHLTDEQTERQRKGVIGFLKKKIATGPLLPDTPAAHVLFQKLAVEAEAKGHRPPEKFPTLAVKEKFNITANNLNGTLETAINKAFESGITAIPKIVSYISSPKWRNKNDNQDRTNANRSSQCKETGGIQFAPEPGSGQSAQTAKRLREAFAPKL